MTDLTDLEKAVLSKLLIGAHPALELLRQQVEVCRCVSRDATGVGCYTYLDATAYTGPRPELELKFGDVVADIDGLEHGAGFVLYVESGLLAMLEAYTFGETWPTIPNRFTLSYTGGDERDWQALTNLLEKRG